MRRAIAAAPLALLLLCLMCAVAPSAAAHGNNSIIRLAISGDHELVTVHAFLVYANDHQPVADEFVLARLAGPGRARSFQLQPDAHVPGLFTAPVHVTRGDWRLSVAARAATSGAATATFTLVDGQPAGVVARRSFDLASVTSEAEASPAASSWSGWIIAAVAAAALGGATILGASVRRVRATRATVPVTWS